MFHLWTSLEALCTLPGPVLATPTDGCQWPSPWWPGCQVQWKRTGNEARSPMASSSPCKSTMTMEMPIANPVWLLPPPHEIWLDSYLEWLLGLWSQLLGSVHIFTCSGWMQNRLGSNIKTHLIYKLVSLRHMPQWSWGPPVTLVWSLLTYRTSVKGTGFHIVEDNWSWPRDGWASGRIAPGCHWKIFMETTAFSLSRSPEVQKMVRSVPYSWRYFTGPQ